jgi:hypothetical protein
VREKVSERESVIERGGRDLQREGERDRQTEREGGGERD